MKWKRGRSKRAVDEGMVLIKSASGGAGHSGGVVCARWVGAVDSRRWQWQCPAVGQLDRALDGAAGAGGAGRCRCWWMPVWWAPRYIALVPGVPVPLPVPPVRLAPWITQEKSNPLYEQHQSAGTTWTHGRHVSDKESSEGILSSPCQSPVLPAKWAQTTNKTAAME